MRRSLAERNHLITEHFELLERVAKRLARRLPNHVSIEELISAGSIGLVEAAERFDPALAERFESFAEFRIKGAMLDELRKRDTLTRDMRKISNELHRASADIANQLGRVPDESEVARQLGVSIDELHARRQKLSGEAVMAFDEVDPEFFEHVAGAERDPSELVARGQLLEGLVGAIAQLPERMQQILALYYFEDVNLKEIGAVLGVTESRVCQIHGEATRRLRAVLEESLAEIAA